MSDDDVARLLTSLERIATLEKDNDQLSLAMSGFATLLDRIEVEAEDMEQVRILIAQRFDVAKDAGFEVIFGEPITNKHQ